MFNVFDPVGSVNSIEKGMRHMPPPKKIGQMLLVTTLVVCAVFGVGMILLIAAIAMFTSAIR